MSQLASPAHRREAAVALAMLPIGAIITIVSAVACVAVVALALASPLHGGVWWWRALWGLAAAAIAGRNTFAGITIMAAFDWRPVPLVLLTSALIVALWPGWWLG